MPRLFVLTLAALLLLAPAAHASFVVSPTHVRSPAVAVGPRGDTVAAWERHTSGRFAIEARVGRGPRALGPVQRFTSGLLPRVAVGADGTAALLWVGQTGTVRVAIARPGHRFGRSRVIDRHASPLGSVGVVIQPGGRVVVAYTGGGRLWAAMTGRGERFHTPRPLAQAGIFTSSIVLDPRDGAVVVAYPTPPTLPKSSQAAVSTLARGASAFTAPVELTDARGIASDPTAISGPGGVAVAIDGGGLALSRRGLDGRWSSPAPFALQPDNSTKELPEFLSAPSAALLADGSAIPVWTLEASTTGDSEWLLRREVYAGNQRLTPAGAIASPPSVAAAGADAFIATAVRGGSVDLFTRLAGATAFTPTTLSSKANGDAQLTASGKHVLAGFQRDDRLRLTVVR